MNLNIRGKRPKDFFCRRDLKSKAGVCVGALRTPMCSTINSQGLIQEINLGSGSRPNNFLPTELGTWGCSECPKWGLGQ